MAYFLAITKDTMPYSWAVWIFSSLPVIGSEGTACPQTRGLGGHFETNMLGSEVRGEAGQSLFLLSESKQHAPIYQ